MALLKGLWASPFTTHLNSPPSDGRNDAAPVFDVFSSYVRAGTCFLTITPISLLPGKQGAESHWGSKPLLVLFALAMASQSHLWGLFSLEPQWVGDEEELSPGSCSRRGVRLSPPLPMLLAAGSCFLLPCPAALRKTHSLHALFALQVEPQPCPYPCRCPSQPARCPAGTSHVLDACGCCKVCARQLGELCSLRQPCDHHKGLYCDFANIHRGSGICLGESGVTATSGSPLRRSELHPAAPEQSPGSQQAP